MTRTKTQIRGSKQKGSSFEMDTLESLQARFPEAYLTHHIGFQLQYDIEAEKFVVECKRHKKLTFKEAVKYFVKLLQVKPDNKLAFLVYKNNNEPAMVMYENEQEDDCSSIGCIAVSEFEDFFRVPFKKHTPIRRVKK